MKQTSEQKVLSFYLPERTLNYFDIVSSEQTRNELSIVLEEKNNPPLKKRHRGLHFESKGFTDITVTDYPARGRKTLLTFRRRRWIVGNETLKRNIKICAPGTRLEHEFGIFLKADS